MWLEDWMDISHCSQGLSDSCKLLGHMLINVCYDFENNILLVDFDEQSLSHDIDYGLCVIDDIHFDVQHPADWICEYDVFYDYYIDEMMQIVVDFFSEEDMSCGSGLTKVRSRYQKDLCIAVCKESSGGKVEYQSYPCGENTVCCVLNEEWCVEEDGTIKSEVISFERIGDGCNPLGNWPCIEGPGSICYTRDCPIF